MLTLPRPIAFQWDSGNKNKNFAKHKTANEECEQAFFDRSKKIYPDVEEIIYLGDLLFPFSDLSNRNQELIKPGYVEEWWKLDLRENETRSRPFYFVHHSPQSN